MDYDFFKLVKLKQLEKNPPYNATTGKVFKHSLERFDISNLEPGVGYATLQQWKVAGYDVVDVNEYVEVIGAKIRKDFNPHDLRYYAEKQVIKDLSKLT